MAVKEYYKASISNLLRAIDTSQKEITDINLDIANLERKVADKKSTFDNHRVVRMSAVSNLESERRVVAIRIDKEINQLSQALKETPDDAKDVKGSIENQIRDKQASLQSAEQTAATQEAANLVALEKRRRDLNNFEEEIKRQTQEKRQLIRTIEQDITATQRIIQSLQQRV